MNRFAIIAAIISLYANGSATPDDMHGNEDAEVFELSVRQSDDRARIQISVFNTRANNARAITSYNQAERLGDLTVTIDGDSAKSAALRNAYSPPKALVWQWVPAGTGFGWSLPLDYFKSRYSLTAGCYRMKFAFTNGAAIRLDPSTHPGPRALPATDELRVCFQAQ